MSERWQQFLSSSSQQEAASDGNRAIYLSDDNEVMHLFWESIARAQKRVWMTMYTLLPDRVGQTTLDELTSAAARGCDVILIYDAVGSSPLKEQHLTPLREVGAHVVKFNPLWPGHRHGHITLRNHRKLLLVDDELAYCGGMNIVRLVRLTPMPRLGRVSESSTMPSYNSKGHAYMTWQLCLCLP